MLIHPRSWCGERTGRGRTEKQSWPLSWHVRSQPTSDPWVVLVLCPGLVWVLTQKSMKTDGSLCQCLWPKIGALIKSRAIWYLKPDTGSSGLSMSLSPMILHSTIQRRAKPDGSFSHPSHFQHGPISPQHPFPQSVLNLCTKGLPGAEIYQVKHTGTLDSPGHSPRTVAAEAAWGHPSRGMSVPGSVSHQLWAHLLVSTLSIQHG